MEKMLSVDQALLVVKLVAGGIVAFLAIMLWSKTRDGSWICLVAAAVFSYAEVALELLVRLGIAACAKNVFWGFGVEGIQLALTCAVYFFVILAFIIMLAKSHGERNV